MDYDRNALWRELTRDEGRETVLYADSRGILTGGVGHNFEANPTPDHVRALLPDGWVPQLGASLTEAAIDALLEDDIGVAERGLDGLLPDWRGMDDVRQRVCLNLCFNMGAHVLAEFKDTLAAIRAGDWNAAAAGLTASAWHRELPIRSARLIAMMKSGIVRFEA